MKKGGSREEAAHAKGLHRRHICEERLLYRHRRRFGGDTRDFLRAFVHLLRRERRGVSGDDARSIDARAAMHRSRGEGCSRDGSEHVVSVREDAAMRARLCGQPLTK